MHVGLLSEALRLTAIVEIWTTSSMDPGTLFEKNDAELKKRIAEDTAFIRSFIKMYPSKEMPSAAAIKKRIHKYFQNQIIS